MNEKFTANSVKCDELNSKLTDTFAAYSQNQRESMKICFYIVHKPHTHDDSNIKHKNVRIPSHRASQKLSRRPFGSKFNFADP